MSGTAEANLQKLGITLPSVAAPAANYLPYKIVGGLLHMSGQLPKDIEGKMATGQLGAGVTVEEGQKAARVCAINLIAAMKGALGNLDNVKGIVKITCYVNAASDFTQLHLVANGCSDLLVSVFGETVGRHARCAVGMAQLPLGAAVEIDALVEVEPAFFSESGR